MGVEVKAQHDEALGAYVIRFNYSKHAWDQVKNMVNVMKVMIPASDREYNPATKEWTILDGSWPKLKQVFEAASFHIRQEKVVRVEDFHYDYSNPISSAVSKETLAAQLIALLLCTEDDLKDEVKLKKLYKQAARKYHPDFNNGNGSMMSELNATWSAYNAQ
jgi:hypothetical protein